MTLREPALRFVLHGCALVWALLAVTLALGVHGQYVFADETLPPAATLQR